MDVVVPTIPFTNLLLGFIPVILLLAIMHAWSLNALQAIYANGRMLIQLLAIGYVLTYVLETDQPLLVLAVIVFMIGVSAWIALRPLADQRLKLYPIVLISIAACGISVMLLVTQLILDLPRWFEPRYVVPLAGMIFANTMNTISLAAERFRSEIARNDDYLVARRTALETALIPQINALLAVGLVSLPGMMTGQILSGIDPLVAVRYQIMVMCMIFASAGLAAACYLTLLRFTKP
ncbi:MAG: ABC transporter permease [Gammaproteobacteria bacterium]|nr:MAG: ABC transporter permease [Gammaproteobacteria bacterium]TDJ36119.1 MAG: ABC transporter permease [Gammaproteobacteria bacterium]